MSLWDKFREIKRLNISVWKFKESDFVVQRSQSLMKEERWEFASDLAAVYQNKAAALLTLGDP